MRVAHVSFFLDPAHLSIEAFIDKYYMLDVPAALAARGADVTVIRSASVARSLTSDGVRVECVVEGGRRGSAAGAPFPPRRLIEAVARARPDVVHVHGLGYPAQLLYLAARMPRTPRIAQDHANKVPERRRRLHRLGVGVLDAVTFTSVEQARPFVAARVLPSSVPVHPVLEGSTTFERIDQARAQDETGLCGDPCLLWVGDLVPNKDPMTILEAVARASVQLPGVRLWCAHRRAPMLDEVRARIRDDPRLRDRVQLLGHIEHSRLATYHSAADLFVVGSHAEGGAYSAIEALACGATPIVSDIPAFDRITARGAFGGMAPPGDAAAFAAALVDWAGRDRALLRRSARGHFEASLSLASIASALEVVYRDTIEERR